jgi:hypothetical protein
VSQLGLGGIQRSFCRVLLPPQVLLGRAADARVGQLIILRAQRQEFGAPGSDVGFCRGNLTGASAPA